MQGSVAPSKVAAWCIEHMNAKLQLEQGTRRDVELALAQSNAQFEQERAAKAALQESLAIQDRDLQSERKARAAAAANLELAREERAKEQQRACDLEVELSSCVTRFEQEGAKKTAVGKALAVSDVAVVADGERLLHRGLLGLPVAQSA